MVEDEERMLNCRRSKNIKLIRARLNTNSDLIHEQEPQVQVKAKQLIDTLLKQLRVA